MGYYGSNYGMMSYFGGGLMMAIFWGALILLIIWLIRELMNGNRSTSSSKSLDILKERYAKGEITKQEFEDKKKDLVS